MTASAGFKFTQSRAGRVVRVYNCADYKETQILRGELEGFLGEWNLAKLKAPGDSGIKNEFTVSPSVHVTNAHKG
jgi:hypothetical protein